MRIFHKLKNAVPLVEGGSFACVRECQLLKDTNASNPLKRDKLCDLSCHFWWKLKATSKQSRAWVHSLVAIQSFPAQPSLFSHPPSLSAQAIWLESIGRSLRFPIVSFKWYRHPILCAIPQWYVPSLLVPLPSIFCDRCHASCKLTRNEFFRLKWKTARQWQKNAWNSRIAFFWAVLLHPESHCKANQIPLKRVTIADY